MHKDFKEYIILNAATPVAVTSSTDATPIVVTATTHGRATGDLVLIYGHTTNVAANGIFKITKLTANTFSLKDRYTGADVAGSGAGAGSSGLVILAPKIVAFDDFRTCIISVGTTGTTTANIRTAGSIGAPQTNATFKDSDTPNFGATVSPTNPYSFLQLVNLDDGTTVNGSTGIVIAGTDINKTYEANINGMKYLTAFPATWTQGAITIKARVYNNL